MVHVNSEFVTATHASDHDPGVARISFDHVAPVLSGPPTNPVATASGPGGATVVFSVTATDDQDGEFPATCTPASGSVFAVGTTPVTCTATDANGNTAQINFSVTVNPAGAAVPALPPTLTALFGLLTLLMASRRRSRRVVA